MLEIYNECVRDLLSKEVVKGGLPVRENPKMGMFYVQGLKKVPVGSYTEIEKRMEQGSYSPSQNPWKIITWFPDLAIWTI